MPRIVYLCWPPKEITGGIKVAFQHVEMLAEAGWSAAIATAEAERPNWFETKVDVIPFEAIRNDDVLVFPENHPRFLAAFAGSAQPKVVFCQNPYLAHQGLAGRLSYADYGVTHIICPSMNVVQYCARRFPGLKVGYTPFFVDHSRFQFNPAKALQVAVIPRKRMVEFAYIADMLRSRYPEYAALPWIYLHGVTEMQVAEGMMRSAIFLSLARMEAHSMTKLEGWATGCIVAGFIGVFGGDDSSTSQNGFWAREDDVDNAVEQLASALRLVQQGGEPYRLMQEQGRITAQKYSREESARHLVQFWQMAFRDFGVSQSR